MSFRRSLAWILSLFPVLVSWSFPSGITEISVFDGKILLPPQPAEVWLDETTMNLSAVVWVPLQNSPKQLPDPEIP